VAGQPQNSSQQSSSSLEFQLVISSLPYCPSPPPPESLTESRYKNPQQTQAQTGRTHDTLGSVLAAETVVQYSLSHTNYQMASSK
jgi:hypothetical protein